MNVENLRREGLALHATNAIARWKVKSRNLTFSFCTLYLTTPTSFPLISLLHLTPAPLSSSCSSTPCITHPIFSTLAPEVIVSNNQRETANPSCDRVYLSQGQHPLSVPYPERKVHSSMRSI